MENSSYKVLHYKTLVQKTTNQIDNVPRMVKNVPNSISTLWYPSARPLKHYRKTGTSSSNTTSVSYSTPDNCNPCINSRRVGTPFKMLGKKDDGDIKTLCCQPGSIISFSGNANIQSGRTHRKLNAQGEILPEYYFDYAMYLKRRGNTFVSKSTFHPIPTVDYTKYPNDTHLDSSHYEQNLPTSPECANITIYKSSNPTFSKQGPVDGSTYTTRRKYNAITTTNASFVQPWGIRLNYTQEPVVFMKNKADTCIKC